MNMRLQFGLLAMWACFQTPALAGAPTLNETCLGKDRQRVPTRYETTGRYFAEARMVGRGESGVVIYINPDRYFLGQRTQQWLYLRQCAHIQQRHAIVEDGERALKLEEEEAADCAALRELINNTLQGSSSGMLRAAIESDVDRLLRDESRWRQVLPGPLRRVSFNACKG